MTACSGAVFTLIKRPVDGVGQNGDDKPNWKELDDFVQEFEEAMRSGGDTADANGSFKI